MKILFLTLVSIRNFNEHGIYQDLIREFLKHNHSVDVVCAAENTEKNEFSCFSDHARLLRVATGKVQKTNIIRKGIETLLIERRFKKAIKETFSDIRYDLIIYSTPPITLVGAVEYIKKRDQAKTYLLLKDIFPQNAVDLGMMRTHGITAPLYWFFRRKEKKLYALSDRIGCMSQANVDYVLKHNPEILPEKVEICPNCIEVQDMRLDESEREQIRKKYGIPLDKVVFVYGGNLGRPQGIPFIIECLRTQLNNERAYFLIVGDGTEFPKLQTFFDEMKPGNMKLMKRLPKDDYDRMIAACDVGMIFLDYHFTIPNFPSRLLSYMQAGLPVLACTDSNTDIGETIVDGGFGWWCESNSVSAITEIIEEIVHESRVKIAGEKAIKYLKDNYAVEKEYDIFQNTLK